MDTPNFQWPTETQYKDGDKGTGAWAIKPGHAGVPETVLLTEDFETLPLDITVVDAGDAVWARSMAQAHTGSWSFKSGTIGNSQTTDAIITVPGGGTNAVRFWYFVSSENNFDFFKVIVNGNIVLQASGNVGWTQVILDLNGAPDVTFRYSKDSSSSSGDDAAYIDDLEFIIKAIPDIPFVYTPLKMSDDGENLKVVILDQPIAITGTIGVDVPHLNCSTDSVTICTDGPLDVSLNETVSITGSVFTSRNVTGRRGTYMLASPDASLSSAADSATGGRWWLLNTSNTITVRLLEVRFTCHLTNLLDLGAAVPQVSMQRITFTGTPSGTIITPAKRDSLDPDNIGTFRTASTGMTVTAGAAIKRFIPVTLSVIGGLLSANTAALAPTEQLYQPRDDSGDIILRQNEGIVWRQSTAGTANEERAVQIDLIWEEFTN